MTKMIADLRQESYKQLQRIEALEAAQQPQQSPEPQWHRLSDVKPSNGMQCLFRVHPNLLHSRGVWVDQSHSLTPSISPSGFYTDRGLFVGDPALIWWSAIEPEAQQPPPAAEESSATAPPAPAAHDPTSAAPLLWLLWNHQGSGSPVGQPIRKYLGMGQFQRMSKEQVEAAKSWGSIPFPAEQEGADG
jgi:hypothetical protein